MPEITGWALTDLKDVKLLGDEKLGSEACARIRGANSLGDTVTLWISRRTYMVHKIVERSIQLGTDESTLYKPEVNAKLPDKTFRFTPPAR
jgi:outer membrane lipoprotein-sorting protein